jgi:hypothetical protein
MCTVTWIARAGGYEVFMNRDELHTRGEAFLPDEITSEVRSPVRRIAPVDRDAGGSWIAVNEYGLSVCLLNHYPAESSEFSPEEDRAFESRGKLVLELSVARSSDEAARLLNRRDLARYRPFTLLLFDPEGPPRLRRWDGTGEIVSSNGPAPPVSSSSYDSAAVVSARRETYQRIVGGRPDPDRLTRYHRSHIPDRGPYSVCMHREDGGTKSLTRVVVTPTEVTTHYHAGPPCEVAAAVVRSLRRAGR